MSHVHRRQKLLESRLRLLIREVIGSTIKPEGFELQLHIPRVPVASIRHGRTRAGGEVEAYGFSGNKPGGGFWTSTLKMDDEGKPTSSWYDWLYYEGGVDWINNHSWIYRVDPSARVAHIMTEADSEAFLEKYGEQGKSMMYGPGDWKVDWGKVAEDWDAVRVDGEELRRGFWYGWDSESTVWFNPRKHLKKEASVTVAPIMAQMEKKRSMGYGRSTEEALKEKVIEALQKILTDTPKKVSPSDAGIVFSEDPDGYRATGETYKYKSKFKWWGWKWESSRRAWWTDSAEIYQKTRESNFADRKSVQQDRALAKGYIEDFPSFLWGDKKEALDNLLSRYGLPSYDEMKAEVKAQEKELGWEEEESRY